MFIYTPEDIITGVVLVVVAVVFLWGCAEEAIRSFKDKK